MSLVVYSTGAIQFTPKDRHCPDRHYSDRSFIKLCQYAYGDYGLEALDIANNKEEIFRISLKEPDLYKFGSSPNVPDELRSNDGTYRLLLKNESREGFHNELRKTLANLASEREASPNDKPRDPEGSSTSANKKKEIAPNNFEILKEIHQLGAYISNGDDKQAANLAEKLASEGVKLHATPIEKWFDDKEFQIEIRIDGISGEPRLKKDIIEMTVYGSTTVHELRIIFQSTYNFPLENQYFFVHGHLAHETSSMNDLNVQNKSLFVLFVPQ